MIRFLAFGIFALLSLSLFLSPARADSVRIDFDKDKSVITMTAHRPKWLGLAHENLTLTVGRWFPNVRFDNAHVEASYAEVVVPTESLAGPDLLDAKNNPQIKFTSSTVEKAGKADLVVKGKLELHGVSQEIAVPVHVDVIAGETLHLTGKFTLKLSEFGITTAKDQKLSNDLLVSFDLVTKTATAVATR